MKAVKSLVLALILVFSSLLITGCWDNIELDEIFIATAVALDKGEEKELAITIEVAKASRSDNSSSDSQGGASSLILKVEADTILEGISKLNFDSSRDVFLKHCQLLLIGTKLAEQGLGSYLDFFLRDTQTRLELVVMLVNGKAGEVFDIDYQQESSTSNYIIGMINNVNEIADNQEVTLLKFVSVLLSEDESNVLPIVSKRKQDERELLEILEMGVFKDDKLISALTIKESFGYIWPRGRVVKSSLFVERDGRQANFYIDKIKSKERHKIIDNSQLEVSFDIEMLVSIAELKNFKSPNIFNLINTLEVIAAETVKEIISNTFAKTQSLEADVFGIGNKIYKESPKLWRQIKSNWNEIYKNANLSLNVVVVLVNNGHTSGSIEMEKVENENR